ncbi:MAG: topoisomerase [Cyanobacteria bacterium RYN_339]|nr:topoisomerase [Cyanobacteria bacterium RYN_339]
MIIVESPNKAKTIRALVGREYDVVATVGHFCDLPVKEMGVDVANGFKPTYVYDPDKKDVVAKLRALRGQHAPSDILVASDADREGEAIAWHIARTIGLKPDQVRRAEFHEITEPGIRRALGSIRGLDLGLVAAQEARRILDRLVGYTVSPVVRDRLPEERDLSAGRVQSVALRVVVDRELAIRAFVAREYWSVHARYPWPGDARRHWEAEVIGQLPVTKPKPIELPTQASATELAAKLGGPHRVAKLTRRETQRKPPAPFITSTMLQKASSRLKMSTDETTRHAKVLFEKGLVTYIRTDSPSVSPEFQQETLTYLKGRYGAGVVPAKPNQYKAKGAANSQGAHECIRPTVLATEHPDGIDPRAQALYALIRETYLASQCKPAKYDLTEAWLTCGDLVLKASGRVLKDPGFLAIFGEAAEEEEEEGQGGPLPVLAEGQEHTPMAIAPKQHWTKPPERFTEASLIKYLEEKGIGRPSTFNSMVAKIRERQFVGFMNKRYLQPTPKGEKLDAELRACFEPVIKEGFTAELETHLDAIAAKEEEWRGFLANFWEAFTPLVDAARVGTRPRPRGGAKAAGGTGGGEIHDPNAPPCPKCQQSFTRRIRSTKTGKDYYICARDSRENKVCGYIAAVDAPADAKDAPACQRCSKPMKLVASRKAYRCSDDGCNTWLDQDHATHPACPTCQGPTRKVEGKGFGCVKWRKEGGEGSCQGWVKWADWTPPKKTPPAPKKPTKRRKPTSG